MGNESGMANTCEKRLCLREMRLPLKRLARQRRVRGGLKFIGRQSMLIQRMVPVEVVYQRKK